MVQRYMRKSLKKSEKTFQATDKCGRGEVAQFIFRIFFMSHVTFFPFFVYLLMAIGALLNKEVAIRGTK